MSRVGIIAGEKCTERKRVNRDKKMQSTTLEEISQMENRFPASVSFSFLYDMFLYIPVYLLIDM